MTRHTSNAPARGPPPPPNIKTAANRLCAPTASAESRRRSPARPRRSKPGKITPRFPRQSSAMREAALVVLYGFHAVREALRGRRRKVLDIYATEAAAQRLEGEIADAGLCSPYRDGRRSRPPSWRGCGASRRSCSKPSRWSLSISPSIVSQSGIVLVLDQITDPHNVGAILRTAAAFRRGCLGHDGTSRPGDGGRSAKAASGGLEHVAIVRVVNLARALEQLGEMGYLRLGLDSEGETSLADGSIAAACRAGARRRGQGTAPPQPGELRLSWFALTCPARSRASMFQMPAPWR